MLDDLLGLRVIFRPTVTKKLPLGLHHEHNVQHCHVCAHRDGLDPLAGLLRAVDGEQKDQPARAKGRL